MSRDDFDPHVAAAAVILIVSIALYLAGIAMTLLKGNVERFKDGFIFSPNWVASAFRFAEPDSWWARQFYDDLQMEKARVRSEFRHRPDEPRLSQGGSSYGVEPEALDEVPAGFLQCTLCQLGGHPAQCRGVSLSLSTSSIATAGVLRDARAKEKRGPAAT